MQLVPGTSKANFVILIIYYIPLFLEIYFMLVTLTIPRVGSSNITDRPVIK